MSRRPLTRRRTFAALGTAAQRYAPPVVVVLILVGLWWAIVDVLNVPPYIFPSPLQVLTTLSGNGNQYWPDIWITGQEILGGFALGFAFAMPLAVAMTRWRPLRDGLYPPLILSQVIPFFVLAVVITLVFWDDGLLPQIVVTALYSFFPIVVTTSDGLRRVDADLVRLLRAAGAPELRILRSIRLPSCLPSLFSGCKLAIVFAVSGAALAEWMGAQSGLGYRIRVAANDFDMRTVIAVAIVLTLLGGLLFAAISMAEYVLLPWNRGSDEDLGGLWRGGVSSRSSGQ